MIASRRKPNATPSSAQAPSPSGPRWSSAAAIAATVSVSGGRPSATTPQSPHMAAKSTAPESAEVAGGTCSRDQPVFGAEQLVRRDRAAIEREQRRARLARRGGDECVVDPAAG